MSKLLSLLSALADRILGRSKQLSWRRLVVWASSIPLLCYGEIDQWVWFSVSALFLGGEVAERVFPKPGGPGA